MKGDTCSVGSLRRLQTHSQDQTVGVPLLAWRGKQMVSVHTSSDSDCSTYRQNPSGSNRSIVCWFAFLNILVREVVCLFWWNFSMVCFTKFPLSVRNKVSEIYRTWGSHRGGYKFWWGGDVGGSALLRFGLVSCARAWSIAVSPPQQF
jgi:hypothetical protein